MLVTVERTITEQIEVEGEYPLFINYALGWYRVINETEAVQVENSSMFGKEELMVRHCINKGLIANAMKDGLTITENEFLDAYAKAFHAIQLKVYPETIQLPAELKKAV